MESKPKVGKGQGYAEGGRVPGYEMDRLPAKKPPGRGMDLAPARRFKGKYEGYAEGGPVDEILPGDGRGGLEIAMPTKNVGRIIAERDLPPLMPEEYDVGQPIGALTPLPEEPFYSPQEPINRAPEIDYGSMPVGVMGGGDEYWRKGGIKDQQAERTRQWYISNGLTPPGETAPREDIGKVIGIDRSIYNRPRPEPVDRVGNRRAMMGDRRDMVMRPGMRGVARRAAPPRMRVPEPQPYMRNQMPVLNPFSPEEIAEYSKGRTFSPEGRFAKGGEVRSKKIAKVMREYKAGKLHSGSKKGPVVKNPKQAMAIALSEARAARKAEGGLTSYEESGSAGGSSVGFKEAFRKAREQGLKEFSWKGDRYSTKLKEQSSSERKVEEKAEPGRKGPLSRGGKRNVSEMSEYKRERKMELPSDRGTSYRSQGDDTGMSASERAGKAREYAMDIATAGAFGKAFKGPVKDLAKGAMRKASEFVGGRKLKQAAAERAAREATPEYKSKAAQMEKFAKEMRARQKMGAKYAEGGEVMSKGPKTRYTAAKGRRQSRERAMEKWAEQRMKHAEMYAPGKSLDMSEYAKGGAAKHSDVKMDKAMVKKAVHKHEKAMHPGKPMTKLNKGGVPSYGRKAMYGGGKC
jgi:hypothetical protein